MAYTFFGKKRGSEVKASVDEELAQELHQLVIKNFKMKRIFSRFKENIWAADSAEMESLSSENRSVKYILCVIDVFTKYAWVKPLKNKERENSPKCFYQKCK